MDSKDKMKLVVAIVILVVAGLLIAWNFGVFDGIGGGSSAPAPVTPTEPPTPPAGSTGQPPVG